MTLSLFEGRTYEIALDEVRNVLWCRWKDAGVPVLEDDLREALSNFAGFAIEYRPRGLVVDYRSFRGEVDADVVGAWRDRAVVPRYNKSDASKLAFLIAPGAAIPVAAPRRDGGHVFQSATFDSEEALATWLGP